MNLINQMMSYDKTKNVNQKCDCTEYKTDVKNQNVEYPPLTEEEIEQIIKERYDYKDEKTKTFIRKALRKHANRYDYSNVIYIKSSKKVEIICRVENHGSFLQTPNSHLNGSGCSICGGNQKLTNEKFIEKSNEVHGIGRYDYLKTNYINTKTKVTIICHNHDEPYEFSQLPFAHIRGQGCPICKGGVKSNTEEFIKKANEKQGYGTYDYSKVEYINAQTEVIIICHNHDEPYEFLQTPNNHLSGKGCPICGGCEKSTTKEFIEKSNEIHGEGTYNYSKVEYVNAHTEVIIICPKHGEFKQTPNAHLNGHGCLICGIEKQAESQKSNTKEFIERANKKHGEGIYNYSKVEYIDSRTDVIIICPKHGEFTQTPSAHLQGEGCPKCNKNKGEESIRRFLTEKRIEFEEQKKFEGCKNINLLKFDFYLPQYNLCIESDGSPHFKKINWNGKMTDEQMKKELELNQYRDNIKNEYCKKNGIGLLRLNNFKTFEDKLTEYFQIHEIIKS